METVNKRTTSILDGIYDLVSRMQEVKVESGTYTARAIRQWKKDTKDKYLLWITEIAKLSDILTKRNDEIANEEEKRKREAKEERGRRTTPRANSTARKTTMARETACRT